MPNDIKTVTIYAASSSAVDQRYIDETYQVAKLIAAQGWEQYNGGGGSGLMGAATRGGHAAKGRVHCVILDKFLVYGLPKGFASVKVVDNMPDRRKGLFEAADAFVTVPGGLGTLDEVTEVMCMFQLGEHHKPIVFLNTNGYYDAFKEFFERCIREKFIAERMKENILFVDTPEEVVQFLRAYVHVNVDKGYLHSSELNSMQDKETSK